MNFHERYADGRTLGFALNVKAVNEDAREVLHLITTPSVDRVGDIVEPKGVQSENFMQNPVVLIDHDYRTEKIVGKSAALTMQDDGIYSRTQFLDTSLARDVFALAKAGVGGWSIGFRPIAYEPREEDGKRKGFRFTKWELLEYSFVAIPANADVVNHVLSKGLVHEENVSVLFRAEPSREAAPGPKVERIAVPDGLFDSALRTLAVAEAARLMEKQRWQTK